MRPSTSVSKWPASLSSSASLCESSAAAAGAKLAAASNEIVDDTTGAWAGAIAAGDVFKTKDGAATYAIDGAADSNEHTYAEVNATTTAFKAGHEYEIVSFGSGQTTTASKTVNTGTFKDVDAIGVASSDISNTQVLEVGTKFTVNKDASIAQLAALNALTAVSYTHLTLPTKA